MVKQKRKYLRVISQAEADEILRDKSLREECERDGVDLSLLVESLQLTPEERLDRHQNAVKMVLAFREAGEKARLR